MIDLILGTIALGLILTIFNYVTFRPLVTRERKRGKRLLSSTVVIDYQIVDLPRTNWSYVPPRKLEIVLTLVVIVLTAIAWSLT